MLHAALKIRARAITMWRTSNVTGDLIGDFVSKSLPVLRDAMKAGHLLGMQEIYRKAPIKFAFDELTQVLARQLEVDGETLNEQYNSRAFTILDNAATTIETELRGKINELISSGVTVREGIRALNEKFNALGLTSQKEHTLEAIFRTNLQVSNQAGQWQAYQSPAINEILWGFRYDAVMDDRTRPAHAAFHDTVLPKDDPFWQSFWPPNGWNCRCNAIPIFEPTPISPAPPDAQPDPGFNFNAGEVYRASELSPTPQFPTGPVRRALPRKLATTNTIVEKKPLTEKQQAAVESPFKTEISRRLRAGEKLDEFRETVRNLDAALLRSPATRRISGYRAIENPYLELGIADIERLPVGELISDRGFMELDTLKLEGAIRLKVTSSRGQPILSPSPGKLLLPRNARFRVLSRRFVGDKLEISVERL